MRRVSLLFIAAFFFFSTPPTFAGVAKGNLTLGKSTVPLQYAYLVQAPDSTDKTKMTRRILLSPSDLSTQLQVCTTMFCVDSELKEGMSMDVVGGALTNYCIMKSSGGVQCAGPNESNPLRIKSDDAKHLVGQLNIDERAAGGAKVDVEFDATLVKTYTQAQ